MRGPPPRPWPARRLRSGAGRLYVSWYFPPDLNDLRKLVLRQWGLQKLELDAVGHHFGQAGDGPGIERRLGEELVTRALRGAFADPSEFGENLDRLGAGIHPVDRLAVSGEKLGDGGLVLREGFGMRDQHTRRQLSRAGDIAA